MTNNTDLISLVIFWLSGSAVALLGNQKIREYKDYRHPVMFLISGILLSVLMSWAFVMASLMSDTFKLPKWLYHNCRDNSSIHYEEEYLDNEGNQVTYENHTVHHTYRVYTCHICGKVEKEMLQ
jgi:hypothetical protein